MMVVYLHKSEADLKCKDTMETNWGAIKIGQKGEMDKVMERIAGTLRQVCTNEFSHSSVYFYIFIRINFNKKIMVTFEL